MKLTKQQTEFVNKYIECGNASEAYRFAYNCQTAKDKTINEKASRLLKEGKVRARIGELQEKAAQKAEMSRDEIIRLNESIINADPLDYVKVNNNMITFKDLEKLPIDKRRLIESITMTSSGVPIVKLMEKDKAVERLCKMLGFDTPKQSDQAEERPTTKIIVEIVSGDSNIEVNEGKSDEDIYRDTDSD